MANLESISAESLRELLDQVDDVAATKRLMVAIAYKELEDLSQNGAAAMFGFSSGWASHWFRRLDRLACEPYEDVLYDEDRPGRPPKLSTAQREAFQATLRARPREAGLDADAWTVPLARRFIASTFGVEYSDRHVRRLLRDAGLSWRRSAEEAGDRSNQGRRTAWTLDART